MEQGPVIGERGTRIWVAFLIVWVSGFIVVSGVLYKIFGEGIAKCIATVLLIVSLVLSIYIVVTVIIGYISLIRDTKRIEMELCENSARMREENKRNIANKERNSKARRKKRKHKR